MDQSSQIGSLWKGKDNVQNGEWYKKAEKYWEDVDSSVDGMLGGFPQLSKPDVEGSRKFMQQLKSNAELPSSYSLALGIGRVSKEFLLSLYDKVDLVELNPKFLETAKSLLPRDRVDQFFCSGLQAFVPERERYDTIWCQWVIIYLTDDHFVDFLKRCKAGLKPGGVIVIKDNITATGFIFDEQDSSVTRCDQMMKDIFKRSGLKLIKEKQQDGFPKDLYPVKMYALQ